MVTSVPDFSFADIIAMLQNVGDWIFVAGLLVAPVMIIIGGAMFLTGGDNPTRVSSAKKLFLWTGVGLALTLLSKGIVVATRSIIGG
jgi:hypothetical protein